MGRKLSKIAAAVVGTGFIGPVHVEGLERAGIHVRGILGTSPEKSKAAAQSLGLEIGYASFEQLLEDPLVTSVHLTSPNRFHFEQTLACFRAGKHVLCEKPLAMNSKESSELCRAAAASGLAAGVNYNVRYYPLCIEAADRVRRGQLGDVYHVTGSYVQDWLHRETDFNWRVLSSEGGSLRAIADIGTHWLDLLSFITQLDIQAVCADLQTVHPIRRKSRGVTETFTGKLATPKETDDIAIDTEDYGSVLLRFASGAHGTMHVSQVTAGHKNCLRLKSQAQRNRWPGTANSPINCGSVIAMSRIRNCCATRHFYRVPLDVMRTILAGTTKDFPIRLSNSVAIFMAISRRAISEQIPTFPTFDRWPSRDSALRSDIRKCAKRSMGYCSEVDLAASDRTECSPNAVRTIGEEIGRVLKRSTQSIRARRDGCGQARIDAVIDEANCVVEHQDVGTAKVEAACRMNPRSIVGADDARRAVWRKDCIEAIGIAQAISPVKSTLGDRREVS